LQRPEAQALPDKRLFVELFLISFLSLYVELFCIRWMSADIRAFTTFRCFPLATCFIGLGLGCAQDNDRAFRWGALSFLLLVAVMKICDWLGLGYLPFPSKSVFSWLSFDMLQGTTFLLYVTFFLIMLSLLLLGPLSVCVSIGSRLGALFNQLKPLHAYCINIAGALLGSLCFTVISCSGWLPWQALLPAVLIFLFYLKSFGTAIRWSIPVLVATVLLAAWNPHPAPDSRTFWSPYQRLDLITLFGRDNATGKTVFFGYQLRANRGGYQYCADLSGASNDHLVLPKGLPADIYGFRRRYSFAYQFQPAADVLVLASGMGNDVAEALRNKPASVDAVDIDPVILGLGKQLNPAHPYQSERVRAICDDARDYCNRCKKKYDLIVFSYLDSHVVTGNSSSVRIDNYVYTKEGLAAALRLLKPHGLMVVSFFTIRDWFTDKLYKTAREAAGYTPLVVQDKRDPPEAISTYFVLGEPVKTGTLVLPANLKPYLTVLPPRDFAVRALTDDWPFLYLSPTTFDVPYLLAVLEVLLLSAFLGRRVLFTKSSPGSWQMFFLGAAFMLLELQSIARLSLFYGATWQTSVVVIAGVLIMILGANLLVLRIPGRLNQKLLYSFLFLALIISYLMPAKLLLSLDDLAPYLGHITATFVSILPMFVAGLIFASAFSLVAKASRALAFNLFGSVAGALLEYLSNYFGIQSLALIATLLYFASFLCLFEPQRGTEDYATESAGVSL